MTVYIRGMISLLLLTVSTVHQSKATEMPFGYESSKDGAVFSFFLTRDGKSLVVGGATSLSSGGWALWDVESGKQRQAALMENHAAHSVALSPDGKLLAAGGNDTELKLFDAQTSKVIARLPGHRAYVSQVAFTPDGKYLVTAADDNMLRVWKVEDRSAYANYRFTSGKLDRDQWKRFPEKPHERAKLTVTFDEVLTDRLERFSVSPDGKCLAVTTGTQKVKLLELLTGKVLATFTTDQKEGGFSVAFSADGKQLAIGGSLESGTIEIWDVQSGKRRKTLAGHKGTVLCLAFSPDAATLVSGGVDDGPRVWDLATGKEKFHIPVKDEDRVAGVAFMPDGKTFAVSQEERPVEFWDLAGARRVSPIRTGGSGNGGTGKGGP